MRVSVRGEKEKNEKTRKMKEMKQKRRGKKDNEKIRDRTKSQRSE